MEVFTMKFPEHNNKKKHYDLYFHSLRATEAEVVIQKTKDEYFEYKRNEMEEIFMDEIKEYMKTKDVYLFEILIGG